MASSSRVLFTLAAAILLAACSGSDDTAAEATAAATTEPAAETAAMPAIENPFFAPSPLPLQYPQFDLIRDEHYLPAFERGMEEQLARSPRSPRRANHRRLKIQSFRSSVPGAR